MALLDQLKKRRTRYDLNDNTPLGSEEITALVRDVLREVPDAFNMQSQRAVILYGDEHRKLWATVDEVFEGKIPADKIAMFSAGAASILFFTDEETIKGMQEQVPDYAHNFPGWARESIGMAQYAVWTALAEAGIGASIQHYNPVIDNAVHEAFDIPAEWTLVSQMVIGGIGSEPGPIDKLDMNERVLTRGA